MQCGAKWDIVEDLLTESQCVVLTGQSEHTIDGKLRLSIPAKYRREEWSTAHAGAAWYCIPWHTGHLRLYTEQTFNTLAKQGTGSITPDEDVAELERLLFGSAERLEMDSAGRVVLPRMHVDEIKLTNEVTVVGARDRIEVHSRAAWKASQQQRQTNMAALLARIASKRRDE